MAQRQWRWRHLAAVAALAAGFAAVGSLAQSSTDKWWPGYGNGPDNSRYFASRQINKSNVNQLQVAWTYPFGDTGSHPIVVRGVVYGRGRNGSLVAVDAKTGKELWIRENMNGMTSRGINYWESADGRDQRLIFAMNSLLQEVDAKTGKSIMTFGTNGVVDLRVGIDGRDPATIGNIQSNTPGEIFENLIILGSATGEGYMSPPGDIRAYDILTGKLVWTFHTVPRPGEFGYDTWPKDACKYIGGTNNWGEMTIDTQRGIAYIPLGSPTYDFYGADRIGANLFGTSIVALDARTGKRLWHFQFVHHDLWDIDPSAAPQLTTIRHNGRNRDVVAVTGKTGWLYVFDRVTGEPIWPIEERPVPKSRDAGRAELADAAAPDQARAYVRHTFASTTSIPYLPAEEAAAFKKRLLAADNKGIFTPISLKDTVHVPTSNGGTLFGGTAAEPRTGAVYVVAHENPGILRLLDPGEGRGGGGAAACRRARASTSRTARRATAPIAQGTESGAPLVNAAADPANNIVAGAPRFDAARDPRRHGDRQGPHAARSRISRAADVDNLVSFLTTPAGGTRTRRRSGGGRGAAPVGSGAPPELIAGSGSAWTRPEAPRRSRARRRDALSGGRARLHALHDQRVQHGRQPHQAAVHGDREVRPEPAGHQVADPVRRRSRAGRAWHHRHGRRRRSRTASSSPNRVSCSAPGVTTTSARGTATPASSCGRRGSAATSSARRRCTRWAASSICSSPPRAPRAAAARRGPRAAPAGPMGWVAYALPAPLKAVPGRASLMSGRSTCRPAS